MNKHTFHVEGMSCGHCQMSVARALKAVAGVSEAEVNLAAKTATVSFDLAVVSLEALKAAIAEAGYEVV